MVIFILIYLFICLLSVLTLEKSFSKKQDLRVLIQFPKLYCRFNFDISIKFQLKYLNFSFHYFKFSLYFVT